MYRQITLSWLDDNIDYQKPATKDLSVNRFVEQVETFLRVNYRPTEQDAEHRGVSRTNSFSRIH